ncbi:MAG: hypothetical protein H0U57_00465 [Tatlockia sp.]|nr:hypothetical protein [Tatlockia sp.]
MVYKLEDIADYANKIADECANINIVIKDKWDDIHKTLYQYEVNFRSDKSKMNLHCYAIALKNAANHFIENGINANQQKTLATFLNNLKCAYREIFPRGKVKIPLPVLEPTYKKFTVNTMLSWLPKSSDESIKVKKILNSQPFKNLEDYLSQVLNEDERDHSYCCLGDFSEPKKLSVLNQLLIDLKSMQTRADLTQFLVDFYSEKGHAQPLNTTTGNRSRYDILNTGQNITTRFLSFFGMQATTIDLIDKLALSVGLDAKKMQKSFITSFELPSPF